MRKLALAGIWVAMISAVIGGISRLTLTPIIVPSRVWAGISVILLLFAIAISVLPKE